ncbi:hypothetical protein AADR41_11105 [Streptomyces sp. CLV115]|uniref:hypothetical protein n=1 Tax=Streptomyces sp. CLV115 TaxID=3138502 RepID=UPI00313C3253
MKLLRTALAAAPVLLLLPSGAASAAPGDVVTAPLSELIASLPVEAEGPRAGYSRKQFKHWIDADRDGCNTRDEVLLRDVGTARQIIGCCTITVGKRKYSRTQRENTSTGYRYPLARRRSAAHGQPLPE